MVLTMKGILTIKLDYIDEDVRPLVTPLIDELKRTVDSRDILELPGALHIKLETRERAQPILNILNDEFSAGYRERDPDEGESAKDPNLQKYDVTRDMTDEEWERSKGKIVVFEGERSISDAATVSDEASLEALIASLDAESLHEYTAHGFGTSQETLSEYRDRIAKFEAWKNS